MPDGGFVVDVDALKKASLGLADPLGDVAGLAVEDIDCDRSYVGHTRLADSHESFTARWSIGVSNLTEDGQQLSRRMIDAAGAYIEADKAHAHTINGIFTGTGDDPAMQAKDSNDG